MDKLTVQNPNHKERVFIDKGYALLSFEADMDKIIGSFHDDMVKLLVYGKFP